MVTDQPPGHIQAVAAQVRQEGQARKEEMTDREFWLMIRAALLAICKAIEMKFMFKENGSKHE